MSVHFSFDFSFFWLTNLPGTERHGSSQFAHHGRASAHDMGKMEFLYFCSAFQNCACSKKQERARGL